MENITFLNLAAQSPSLELNLALSEKVQKETELPHTFFMCNSAFLSCSVNIDNKKSICRICKFKAKKGFQHYKKRNPNSKLIKISRNDIIKNQLSLNNNERKEIQLGVDSTIASQLRLDDLSVLNKKWKNRRDRLLQSSIGQLNFFKTYISKNQISNFIFFNGRISCARPLIVVSKVTGVDFIVFDAAINGKTPMYSKNQMFHSIEFEKHNSIKTYLKHFKESRKIAEEYMFKKQNRISLNHDRTYTAHQKEGYLNKKIKSSKNKLISVFTSSDDEYRFIGIDWEDYGIVDQIESIKKLARKLNNEYTLVVKMHPNQKSMHQSVLEKYKTLENEVLIIWPEDKTDTYELIQQSYLVINFCSSIGIEANYLRKPVVQIGASRTIKLPSVNYVQNAQQAIKLIEEKSFKLMPLRSSIIYFTYLMKSNFKLESYNYVKDGDVKYGQVSLKAPFIYRLMAVPSKLIFNYEKGNKILKDLGLHLKNLIFGINEVK